MGSDVQAEVPGAMVVSLSSNLDYLLWATTLFSLIFVVLYVFKILFSFFLVFWVSCRFDQTVYEDFLYFFQMLLLTSLCLIIHFMLVSNP